MTKASCRIPSWATSGASPAPHCPFSPRSCEPFSCKKTKEFGIEGMLDTQCQGPFLTCGDSPSLPFSTALSLHCRGCFLCLGMCLCNSGVILNPVPCRFLPFTKKPPNFQPWLCFLGHFFCPWDGRCCGSHMGAIPSFPCSCPQTCGIVYLLRKPINNTQCRGIPYLSAVLRRNGC